MQEFIQYISTTRILFTYFLQIFDYLQHTVSNFSDRLTCSHIAGIPSLVSSAVQKN